MAIIKFVSDKNFQLFVDMELVGDVITDKMLKITLDAGSYLVEGKDANGKSIGKYKLTVNPSDTQVLENLSEKFSKIDDAVCNLRNDSSLRFYHQRAIFCYNGNYGYINSQYKIVIEPIYSYAENFTNGLALVKKVFPDREKATIIDINGNITLDRWYDYIGGNEKTVLLKSEKNFYVLSKADYSLVNQYIDAKYDGKGELIPVHKHIGVDDMYGYIDRTGTETIPLIYDFAGNFRTNNLASVKRFGNYNSIDLNGNLYRNGIHSYNKVMEIRKKIVDNEPFDTNSYNNEFLSKEDSLYRGFDNYPMKEQNGWKIRINETEEICDHVFDDWHNIGDKSLILFRKDGVCKLISKEYIYDYWRRSLWEDSRCESKVLLSIEADAIIPAFSWDGRPTSEYLYLNYIIVRSNWKYGIVDLDKNTILPIEYDFIEPTDAHNSDDRACSADIAIVWKGEKCSLYNMQDKSFLVPFEFEDIIVNENLDDSGNPIEDSTYLMKKNGKYGLLSNDCKSIILPYEYDKIFYDIDREWRLGKECERMILTKEGKMEAWQKYHYYDKCLDHWSEIDVRIDEKYDECFFLKDKNYYRGRRGSICDIAVKRGNKWGVIKYKEKENGDVISNKKEKFDYNSLDEILQEMGCKYFSTYYCNEKMNEHAI